MKRNIRPFLLTLVLCITTDGYLHGQSRYYEMFAPDTNLHVTFFKGYQIDSTTKIDITLIYTTDTVAWERLLETLNVRLSNKQKTHLYTRYVLQDDISHPHTFIEGQSDLLTCIPRKMSICFFHNPRREMFENIASKLL